MSDINKKLFAHVLGQAILIVGALMLIPLFHALYLMSTSLPGIFASIIITMTIGEALSRIGRNPPEKFTLVDAAGVMVTIWPLFAIIGMLPFLLSGEESLTDAFFESVSCITSTGVSLLNPFSPQPLFMWRCILSWIGSLTFIIMLATVAPPVCGSLGLIVSYKASLIFSPMTRRMKKASIAATKLYVGLTAISICLFMTTGIGVNESVKMALMALSTGGWSEHTLFLLKDNTWLDIVATISMMFACVNFLLYFEAVKRRDLKIIFKNAELRIFCGMVLVFTAVIAFHLWYTENYTVMSSIRYAFFHVISFSSTSGFLSADVNSWPDFDRFTLLMLVVVGGCIGSLSGGIKVKRIVILFKMTLSEMRRSLHPHMVSHIGLDNEIIPMRIVMNILCYFFVHLAILFIFTLILSLSDIRLPEATGIAIGLLSSVGSASGLYGLETFSSLSTGFKIICCIFMMIGRMEIFALMLWLSGESEERQNKW